mmetsp:Transcript_31389/g.47455  ORF Transcript_31389/g.47455 Transcript_31389/m.47455 type:complete len:81 (+) Transcript_31389:1-243(+)
MLKSHTDVAGPSDANSMTPDDRPTAATSMRLNMGEESCTSNNGSAMERNSLLIVACLFSPLLDEIDVALELECSNVFRQG